MIRADQLNQGRHVAVYPWMIEACDGDAVVAIVLGYLIFGTYRGQRWLPTSSEQVAAETGLTERQSRRALTEIRRLGLAESRRIESWNPALKYALIVDGAIPADAIASSPDDASASTRDDASASPHIEEPEVQEEEQAPGAVAPAVDDPRITQFALLSPPALAVVKDKPKPERKVGTGSVLGAYLEWCKTQDVAVSQTIRQRLGKAIKEALAAGHSESVVKTALMQWHKEGQTPASLPSFIDSVARNGGQVRKRKPRRNTCEKYITNPRTGIPYRNPEWDESLEEYIDNQFGIRVKNPNWQGAS